ncbi:hypothetical protein BCR35DRAFT_308636 [Leucosporidium creatinivorum]|uniref:Uncharacterized protein n=1 Tax=Leucosporidium creatinivorum TaxID=106004 RepID=A0A1Y2DZU3_9BASI|nr:hypothetical protein BCR35DRAFT_308636 [Leucosporidium creatinivorum]
MRARAATTQVHAGTTWGLPGGSSTTTPTPPSPLSRFSAATRPDPAHPSGWQVKVHLDREGRAERGFDACWRSGERLQGFIELERTAEEAKTISSVLVRAGWISATIYTALRLQQVYPDQSTSFLAKLKPASSIQAISELKDEWHRSHCDGGEGVEVWNGGELADISREVEGDFPLLAGGVSRASEPPPPPTEDGRITLPFAFALPTSSRVTSSSVSLHPPRGRRDLQLFDRTPPPSLPGSDGLAGVVEWFVEVLIRFQDAEPTTPSPAPLNDDLPSFRAATRDAASASSAFGLLQSSPTLLVSRITFPFEPRDHHAQDLYSSWRPNIHGPWSAAISSRQGIPIEEVEDDRPITEDVVPRFGRDPRDEALGGSNMGTRRKHRGVLVEQEGGRGQWSSFEKRMAVKSSRLGRVVGWVRSETSIPYPSTFARHALHLPVILHLSFTLPDSTSSNPALSPPNIPLRSIAIDKVVLILSRRTLARGGRDDRPTFGLDEMRRVEMKLWDDIGSGSTQMDAIAPVDSRSSVKVGEVEDGRPHLRLESGGKGVDLKLEFPMQTELGSGPYGNRMKPCRELQLSTRTPNFELEYILSITIHPVGQPSFYALRAPLQILAGDFMDTPSFSAATEGSAASLAGSASADGLPSYE